MVGALRHVLFARPQQLDRHAGHLLGDLHRLRDVVGAGAPAEAAAGGHHRDLDLVERQARRFDRGGEHRLGVLRRGPDLALVGRVARGGVERLHAGVVLVGIGVDRLDLLGRAGERGVDVAGLVADELASRLRGLPSGRRRSSRSTTLAPGPSSQTTGSASSAVLACHQVSATTATALPPTSRTFFTPFMPLTLAASKLTSLPPRTGQALIAAFSMPGSWVSTEYFCLPVSLSRGVEPRDRLAGDLPGLGVLELDALRIRRLDLGGGERDLP